MSHGAKVLMAWLPELLPTISREQGLTSGKLFIFPSTYSHICLHMWE